MILVDTSVWIDHFRHGDPVLAGLLRRDRILVHEFVIGELALGHLQRREMILELLTSLPEAAVANPAEVLHAIDRLGLSGLGVGYVDVHLLASTLLTPGTVLWTRNRPLHAVARRLSLAMPEPA